jgi:membrane protease YdiL (CAAX protease family)
MSIVKGFFWNGRERRLRAGWRVIAQLILFILVQIILGLVGFALGKVPGARALGIALYAILGLGLIWLVARFVDRRRLADYGFRFNPDWWRGFAYGAVLGAGLMTGIFLAERSAGWITVTTPSAGEGGIALAWAVALSFVFYLTVAVMEEFTSRGFQIRNLSEGIACGLVSDRAAIIVALLLSSSLFGLLHLLNQNATALSTINIMLAGVLLALPYVLTGELGASIGLHLTWNFFQGTVYGFPVSGTAPGTSLCRLEQSGPDLWTGGKFGPEAGLMGVVAMLAGGILVPIWVRSRYRRVAIDVEIARYEPRETAPPSIETVAQRAPN